MLVFILTAGFPKCARTPLMLPESFCARNCVNLRPPGRLLLNKKAMSRVVLMRLLEHQTPKGKPSVDVGSNFNRTHTAVFGLPINLSRESGKVSAHRQRLLCS